MAEVGLATRRAVVAALVLARMALSGVLVSGCAPPAPDPRPTEEFCAALASVRCEALVRCCAAGESPLPRDEAACRTVVLGQCDAAVVDPVRRGAAHLDMAAADACLEGAGSCGAHLLAFCDVLVGDRREGEPCAANVDCALPAVCLPLTDAPQGEVSFCFDPQPVGGPCDSTFAFCGPGAICDAASGLCVLLPVEGERCTSACAGGLACVSGSCRVPAPEGAPCESPAECTGRLCRGGLCAEPCGGA